MFDGVGQARCPVVRIIFGILRGSGLKSCRTVREFLVAGSHRWLEMPGPTSPDAPVFWVLLIFFAFCYSYTIGKVR